jgi:hypothetical protein
LIWWLPNGGGGQLDEGIGAGLRDGRGWDRWQQKRPRQGHLGKRHFTFVWFLENLLGTVSYLIANYAVPTVKACNIWGFVVEI